MEGSVPPFFIRFLKKWVNIKKGEYIPFISSLRGIIGFFDMPMSNVKHGNKNQQNIAIFQDKTINFAPLICFDIAFSNTVRKSNKSSYFMINISNDTSGHRSYWGIILFLIRYFA